MGDGVLSLVRLVDLLRWCVMDVVLVGGRQLSGTYLLGTNCRPAYNIRADAEQAPGCGRESRASSGQRVAAGGHGLRHLRWARRFSGEAPRSICDLVVPGAGGRAGGTFSVSGRREGWEAR